MAVGPRRAMSIILEFFLLVELLNVELNAHQPQRHIRIVRLLSIHKEFISELNRDGIGHNFMSLIY